MKIVISAGGTGGHIYPAIAIINKISIFAASKSTPYNIFHKKIVKNKHIST